MFKTEVREEGTGDPLLYLHGMQGAGDPLIEGLAKQHRVIAPVHPGFGASTGDEHLLDIHDLIYYYLDYMDAEGLRDLPIVGHSLGGMFAAELAAVQPGRFTHVVLIDPLGMWNAAYPVPDFFVASPTDVADMMYHDPASSAARAALSIPANEGDVAAMLERVKAQRVAAKYLWPLPNKGLSRRLHRISAPTLLVWGESDGLSPTPYAKDFQRLIRGSRIEMIPEAGHLPQVEQPEATVNCIEAFLA
jgi:pimeloyl-ACP methyl ester carboxylesterase